MFKFIEPSRETGRAFCFKWFFIQFIEPEKPGFITSRIYVRFLAEYNQSRSEIILYRFKHIINLVSIKPLLLPDITIQRREFFTWSKQ